MSVLFAREGAHVVCLDNDAAAAAATVAQIRQEGGTAYPLVFDVRDAEGIPATVAAAKRLLGGRLDGLVLSAAVTRGLPLQRITAESWDAEFAVNVRALVLFLKECVALKALDDGGGVVLISSMAGQRASGAGPAYETAKAGLNGLIRAGARVGEARGVRCNGVAMVSAEGLY
jgi:NAD(P)-dependent dehydrogenase (short-subunit alcohol dehydrogenase family)